MKTIATIATIVLVILWVPAKSFNVKFNVSVKVDKTFSLKNLNMEIVSGDMKKGEIIKIGNHNDYLLAMKDKQIIQRETGNYAEVIAEFKHETISLDDAFSLLNDLTYLDRESATITAYNKPNDFYYSIEILTGDYQTLDMYLKICPELENYIRQTDENLFVAGKLHTHREAIAIQNKFVEAGLPNNIIVAFEGEKQVPVYLVAKNK